MSKKEFELREEQRKFDDLMVVYLKLQRLIAIHKAHPTWFAPTSMAVNERAEAIWNEMYSTIPITFLIELRDMMNERQINMMNQS